MQEFKMGEYLKDNWGKLDKKKNFTIILKKGKGAFTLPFENILKTPKGFKVMLPGETIEDCEFFSLKDSHSIFV